MSADQTSADDHEDAAFRARLAPLASEILPRAAKLSAMNEAAVRPKVRRRLAGRAAIAREASAAAGSSGPSAEITVGPPRLSEWRAAILGGIVLAIGAAGAAWLYPRSIGSDKPVIGAVFTEASRAPGISMGASGSAMTAAPLPTAVKPGATDATKGAENPLPGSTSGMQREVAAVPPHATAVLRKADAPTRAAASLPRSTKVMQEVTAAPPPATLPPDPTGTRAGATNFAPVANSTNGGSIPRTSKTAQSARVDPRDGILGGSDAPDGSAPVESGSPSIVPMPGTVSRDDAAGVAKSGTGNGMASPTDAMIGLLLQRGEAALAVGDIIAARLHFERAAALGSATAATAAGKTYDIDFLLRAGARGIRADQAQAAAWFRKGAVLGDPEARTRLERTEAQSRR